ncbi:AraC family transcriptional regulator [Allorhizocola rhizosphaerae]|uniref:AraC family transcriptional regulator n=1 Tax=Allorhizocola rhizosphaerae TaxID=1872709 RepID=UPI000E3BDFAF|nr:AraC family transcriptional regulator [Allorhizocola rhizosphaerae]
MSWTARLNDAVPKLLLGGVSVDVYEWAQWTDTVANPPHRHTYFEICRVEGGRGEFVVSGRRHAIGAGDLLFARPGVRHQILSPDPPGIQLVWVAFDMTPAAAVSPLLQGFLAAQTPVVRDDGSTGAIWRALRAVADRPTLPGQHAQLASLAQALLLGLARAGLDSPPAAVSETDDDGHGRAIRNATRYIHDNLDRPLRVEELARHVHVSPRQLTRLFTDGLGTSPASYVERVRLDRAAALLVRTQQPIKHIAAALGYPDVASFTRAFGRRHGQPPGRFRSARDLSKVLTAPELNPNDSMTVNP